MSTIIDDSDDENPVTAEERGDGEDEPEHVSESSSDEDAEPSCDRANSLPFAKICQRMEELWSHKIKKKKVGRKEQLKYLLPPKLLQAMENQSVFPLFRILMPDIDHSRNVFMKEKLIAQMYCEAEGFSKGSSNYEMLYGYTDPQKVPHEKAGDLSLVVEHVLEQRTPKTPSSVTIGQMNSFLDDLARISQGRSYSHEWRDKTTSKKEKVSEQRGKWLRKVARKGLSPVEHKWLVRILLKKMEYVVGWQQILKWYNPYSMDLWSSHNSLKHLCDKLADPSYTVARRAEQARIMAAREQGNGIDFRWEPGETEVKLGHTISPMLSTRAHTDDCMATLQMNHQKYLKSLPASAPLSIRESLTLRHPAVCAEIKYDGERMVAHVEEGKVTIQTRNSKWYSRLYSPVLGPPLRRALSKYNVNVILDGEVEAWDDREKQLIPFGNNRTVALARAEYMARHGLADKIDQDLHAGPDGTVTDPSVVHRTPDEQKVFKKNYEEGFAANSWLLYLVFDILYVDGADAKKLLKDCLMDEEDIKPGNLLGLTLLQRKIILKQLLLVQPKQVEFGKTMIIRPNGDCIQGEKYFSIDDPLLDDDGHRAAFLDSTQSVIQGSMPAGILDLDRWRRKGRSDEEIARARAIHVEGFCNTVVDTHKMEGLVLKDLASPYVLGMASRSRKFWLKFKPDYEGGETLDVTILGAFYATGLRHSGQISHFLCGVVDDNDPHAFMTIMSVNGKSTKYAKLAQIMELTGFKAATYDEPVELGKWFEDDEVPDFISQHSFQRNQEEGDYDGWVAAKKLFPDLWIRPEDSMVLEIKGQEFVPSTEYSAGLTLRFPRITFVRHEMIDGGPKSVYDIDTHQSVYRLYFETTQQRLEQQASMDRSAFSPSLTSSFPTFQCRFLTPEEYAQKTKKKRKRKAKTFGPSQVPKVSHQVSRALAGVTFTVLEGEYRLDKHSLEAEEARYGGWFEQAARVKTKDDVMEYIILHGGSIRLSSDGTDDSFVIGGQDKDAKVTNYMKAIENARAITKNSKSKSKKMDTLRKISEKDGVLKWTFVYSIVSRFLANQRIESDSSSLQMSKPSIREQDPWILKPKMHDFLARANPQEGTNDFIFDLNYEQEITKMELLRALDDIVTTETDVRDMRPWQYEMNNSFEPEDRWCLVGHDNGRAMILYPNIFDTFGLEDEEEVVAEFLKGDPSQRWGNCTSPSNEMEWISSVLPLASTMGAIVTCHLHRGVTHVLSQLQGDAETGKANDDKLLGGSQGKAVRERLKLLGKLGDIVAISPQGIHSLWRKRSERLATGKG